MTRNAETPRAESGAFQKVHGGTDPTVAQLRRRREGAARCEPLECGHRDPLDCQAEHRGKESEPAPPADVEQDTIDPSDFVKLWADAKILFLAHDFPEYGSQPWRDLAPDSPQRLAAALDAAENWRKYGPDVVQWLKEASEPRPPIWAGVTLAELREARKPKPAHQLQASPGWPPIRIPGGRGRHLTYEHQREAAA